MHQTIEQLLSLMQNMHDHARRGQWTRVAEGDVLRRRSLGSLPASAVDPLSELDQQIIQQILQLDQALLKLAKDEKQRLATEHNDSRRQHLNCRQYQQTQRQL